MAWFKTCTAGIPTELKDDMNNVLNKKFGTNKNYPSSYWPSDVNLLGPLPEKKVCGSIVKFSDGADNVPIKVGIFYIDYTGSAIIGMTITHNETVSTVEFDTSIYGGYFHSETGILTSTLASDGTALQTPVNYNIGIVLLNTDGGANTFSCDTGKCKIIYRATDGWIRPYNYPDLDALALQLSDTDEVVYLTYDLTKGEHFIGLYLETTGTWYVDRGHIEDGIFVADYTVTKSGDDRYYESLSLSNGQIQLWRARGDGTNHITNWKFANGDNLIGTSQCCVERSGNLGWMTDTSRSSTITYCCYNIIRDSLNISKYDSVTTLYYTWYDCTNLESLDVSGWDTSNWAVTSMGYTWSKCVKLKNLDLSGWDTSNWAVTSLSNAWSSCISLENLDVSGWDTSNWAVTSMYYAWSDCHNLKNLDASEWDTSNWAVTTIDSAWNGCYSLESLYLSDWNTSNWTVTSIKSAFCNCYNLKNLDVSGWDTYNWTVTNINYAFSGCYSLYSLDLSEWNTSNWQVGSMAGVWSGCYNLKELDLSDWNVRNWRVSSLSSTWDSCRALDSLDLSGWNTSNWPATGLSNTWAYCTNLNDYSGLSVKGSHSYADCKFLTVSSLVNILTALPTVSGKKIKLGDTNIAKLTAEQIAIATDKGWTVE